MSEEKRSRSMIFYRGEETVTLDEDGMMSPPELDPTIFETLDLSPIAAGSDVDVLFKAEGFSLVRARFKAGYRLPRHSHSGKQRRGELPSSRR